MHVSGFGGRDLASREIVRPKCSPGRLTQLPLCIFPAIPTRAPLSPVQFSTPRAAKEVLVFGNRLSVVGAVQWRLGNNLHCSVSKQASAASGAAQGKHVG